ncbi:MAG: sulfurtransferase TusA family protein [Halobacteria archaeon]|nr:sulfurtransferase TusA family protein [Halobacteria archaeon]
MSPTEITKDEADEIDADMEIDVTGEVCPYPQLEAKKAMKKLSPGETFVEVTDHVDSVENVPEVVGDDGDVKYWDNDGTFHLYVTMA